MTEVQGDIFALILDDPYAAAVITTNGIIKSNGEAVMGAGLALQAAKMYPLIPSTLGRHLKRNGNIPVYLGEGLFTFPTKNDWREDSNIDLITESARRLVTLTADHDYSCIYIPRVGTGLGKLSWSSVRAVIEPILSSYPRFVFVRP